MAELIRSSQKDTPAKTAGVSALLLGVASWASLMALQWAILHFAKPALARVGLHLIPAAVPHCSYSVIVIMFSITAFFSILDGLARPERRQKARGS